FNSLPYELASYIFELATLLDNDNGEEERQPLSRKCSKMPTVLASVSREWRYITLQCTPRLWSHLEFIPRQNKLKQQQSQLFAHVSRSQKCPLDIFINLRAQQGVMSSVAKRSYHKYASAIPEILEVLFPQMDQWRSLTIFCDLWGPFVKAFELLNASTTAGASCLEILEILEFQSCGDLKVWPPAINPSPRSERMACRVSFKALFPSDKIDLSQHKILPRLRHMSLRGVPMNWIALSQQLGAAAVLKSLHSLELSRFFAGEQAPTSNEFSAILTACPHLRKVAMRVFRLSNYKRERNPVPVTLFQLEELCLEYGNGFKDAEHAMEVLKHINAPKLSRLFIIPCSRDSIHSGPDPQPLIAYAREWCAQSAAEVLFTSI
ncbi:hypothetical protein DFJ58DRAFT_668652, partial [Suillus subalutaceus]|uniref:uncharacterized protein n=1 Tax=Suillus subalutaceus TaxID=48586 RepID=UPI001B87FAB5